jgi:hypothetical protein
MRRSSLEWLCLFIAVVQRGPSHSRCGGRLRTSLDAAMSRRLEERATTCRLLRTQRRRTQIGTRLSARSCKAELVRLIEAAFDNLVCRIPAIIRVVGQGRWPLAALGPTTNHDYLGRNDEESLALGDCCKLSRRLRFRRSGSFDRAMPAMETGAAIQELPVAGYWTA